MSTQYHQRQSAINDSSGGSGCAIFLIVAGVGLAIAAILFGAVIAFFTIDASETTTTGFVIEDEVEVVVAATDRSAEATPASYPERIYGLVERLRTSSDDYTELMARIGEGDEAWENELAEVFATWREIDTEVNQIVPSPSHEVSHELLKQATGHYRDAADAIESRIMSGEENPFEAGSGSITSGAIALQLAETTLANELE